ncbi:MAG: M23 family metallopeptidase [Desulfotignum sp.]|nr:M23 family metallopeptidase [Desulfotignum sp.]
MSRFTSYLEALAVSGSLGDGIEWLFFPGMLPQSSRKWWGDFGCRHCAHEGIDICFFRHRGGLTCTLGAGAAVCAWSDGTVLNICDDFLGRTLVVEPEKKFAGATRILEVFSHLEPGKDMKPGIQIQAGQIIARTSDTRARGSVLRPHLHLSCIEVRAHTPVQALDWSLFASGKKVNLLNPVFM